MMVLTTEKVCVIAENVERIGRMGDFRQIIYYFRQLFWMLEINIRV